MTQKNQHNGLEFLKMHGLGNDFVILDGRGDLPVLSDAQITRIGHRHFGIGFDQLAVIKTAQGVDAELVFYNQDGSISGACGNATRCIAGLIMQESGKASITLRTERGDLACRDAGNGLYSVNMGAPLLDWSDVPLASPTDTLELPIEGTPSACGMGNPHMTFIVEDAEAVDLAGMGAEMEHHPLYPQRTNVEFISLLAPNEIRMRIWERGVGVTLASGSGSSAAAVTAARRGLTGREVRVHTDGGILDINWTDEGVWMTGPTALVARGSLSPEFLAG